MTLSNTARLVIETTAKSEGVALARVKDALALMEGNAPSPPGRSIRLESQKEHAARWNVTVRTVQRWIEMGEVKAIKRGRIVRIPVPEDEF